MSNPNSRKLSQTGIDLLKQLEGCKLDAYLDSGGVPTIGVGHTGPEVSLGMTITQDEADDLLHKDIAKFEQGVDQLVKVQLNDNQFSALVIFAYNIGLTAFKLSGCLARVNEGYHGDMVTEQMKRWCHAGGIVIPGLVNRRAKEIELFKRAV